MNYEILDENGDVINTIAADAAFVEELHPGRYRALPDVAPVVVLPPWTWYIDLGSFYDRFGATKMAVLTSADAGVKAIIADLNIRKWADLKMQSVADGLAYVGTKVPALTPALQSQILNNPVQPDENLALRKLYFS